MHDTERKVRALLHVLAPVLAHLDNINTTDARSLNFGLHVGQAVDLRALRELPPGQRTGVRRVCPADVLNSASLQRVDEPFVLTFNCEHDRTRAGNQPATALPHATISAAADLHYLRQKFGNATADLYAQNLRNVDDFPHFMKLAKALDILEIGDTPPSYVHWRLSLFAVSQLHAWRRNGTSASLLDHRLPPHMRADGAWMRTCMHDNDAAENLFRHTAWGMLTIGVPGSSMFFHADSHGTDAASVQLRGRKRWLLCDGRHRYAQRPLMYNAPSRMRQIPSYGLDAFAPDFNRFWLFAKANCSDVIVHAGETLFYPSGFWHTTLALDAPTVSLQSRVITAINYDVVARDLQQRCTQPQPDVHNEWSPNLNGKACARIAACKALWQSWFAQNAMAKR